jgi:hypothetical protein
MPTEAYREVLYQVQRLTDDEKLQLLADLAIMLRSQVRAEPKHSILEFEGFAKEIWDGIDVEKYIEEERNSWDR